MQDNITNEQDNGPDEDVLPEGAADAVEKALNALFGEGSDTLAAMQKRITRWNPMIDYVEKFEIPKGAKSVKFYAGYTMKSSDGIDGAMLNMVSKLAMNNLGKQVRDVCPDAELASNSDQTRLSVQIDMMKFDGRLPELDWSPQNGHTTIMIEMEFETDEEARALIGMEPNCTVYHANEPCELVIDMIQWLVINHPDSDFVASNPQMYDRVLEGTVEEVKALVAAEQALLEQSEKDKEVTESAG